MEPLGLGESNLVAWLEDVAALRDRAMEDVLVPVVAQHKVFLKRWERDHWSLGGLTISLHEAEGCVTVGGAAPALFSLWCDVVRALGRVRGLERLTDGERTVFDVTNLASAARAFVSTFERSACKDRSLRGVSLETIVLAREGSIVDLVSSTAIEIARPLHATQPALRLQIDAGSLAFEIPTGALSIVRAERAPLGALRGNKPRGAVLTEPCFIVRALATPDVNVTEGLSAWRMLCRGLLASKRCVLFDSFRAKTLTAKAVGLGAT